VDGTTFIVTGTSEDTPRFDYDPTSGRRMLLIEPTRTNLALDSNWVDAGANDVPDGWVALAGAAGTDYNCVAGGPHGGLKFRIEDTAVNPVGVYDPVTGLNAATTYSGGAWYRRTTTAGAAQMYGWELGGAGGTQMLSLGATLFDWTRIMATAAQVGNHTAVYFFCTPDDVPGVIEGACTQIEAGDCLSSWIPSAGGATVRAAELYTLDTGVVPRTSGSVSFLWRPDFASTAALSVSPVLFAWAPNWELYFDPADDKLKLTVDGAAGAESAALTFARQALFRLTVRYGTAGTQLTVAQQGVATAVTTDPSAWGTPTLASYLGSRAASANCRPAAYGDLRMAA